MKILTALFGYNEGSKIKTAISRHPKNKNYDLLVFDDGSTDKSIPKRSDEFAILRHANNKGIGCAIKKVFSYASNKNYDILVVMAGNGKDNPLEIPRLINPILSHKADLVQGSRFLQGGEYKNTPLHRFIATKYFHPLLMSLCLNKKITDSTNGFRAYRVSLLKDKRINWRQKWLDRYELEPYMLYMTIRYKYHYLEVPVSKNYPAKGVSYSKMIPLISWWQIIKPILFLALGIKK